MQPPTSEAVRIIVLAGWAGRARRLSERCAAPGREVIPTDDAYGAAVDVLRGDVSMVVVDLLSVRQAQLGLLTIAARRDVPRLGVGRPEAQGTCMVDLMIVSPEQMATAVNTILTTPTRAAEPAKPAEPAEPVESVEPAKLDEAQPADRPQDTQPEPEPAPAEDAPPAAPGDAADVLTAEEVSALLERPSS